MAQRRNLETRDSSAPVITRAVAAAIRQEAFEVFEFPLWQKLALGALRILPPDMIRKIVIWNSKGAALDPALADKIRMPDLVHDRLRDYFDLEGPFDTIIIGAALGGAAAHIAAILGAPFLPQPFVLGFQGGSASDSIDEHCARAIQLVDPILKNNADIQIISHFDPVHDGWLTRWMNHVRIKLLRIPPAYQEFIQQNLKPGGTILYLNCQAEWLQYELGERHKYQVGGWGGIPAEEFYQGSERIDDGMKSIGSDHRGGWQLEGFKLETAFESEWGSVPGLLQSTQEFAERNGICFECIQFKHPHDYSRLAFKAHQEIYARWGVSPQGVLVEMFTQYDPVTVLRGGLLPLWLIFNTNDSLAFLKEHAADFPAARPVLFSALTTFSRTPDLVPWSKWSAALPDFDVHHIGASAQRYPEDTLALWRWHTRLRSWVDKHEITVGDSLPLQVILNQARQIAADPFPYTTE